MRSILHPVFLSLGLLAATSAPAWAATDCFLKLDGVTGMSSDEKHRDEIDVLGFTWDAKNAAGFLMGGASSPGKLVADSFRVTMASSNAAPALLHLAATGRRQRMAVLACRRAGGLARDTTTWTMTDVTVTSFQTVWSGASGAEPVVEVGLSFGRVVYEYVPLDAKGQNLPPVKLDWDLVRATVNFGGGVPVAPSTLTPVAPVAPVAPSAAPLVSPPAAGKAKLLYFPLPTK